MHLETSKHIGKLINESWLYNTDYVTLLNSTLHLYKERGKRRRPLGKPKPGFQNLDEAVGIVMR